MPDPNNTYAGGAAGPMSTDPFAPAVRSGITTEHKVGDDVNHPTHYNKHPSGIECIEVARHMTFNVGIAIKHLWRSGLKDGEPSLKDLKKAAWYLNDEIQKLERENRR
jgi:hypothetical protein